MDINFDEKNKNVEDVMSKILMKINKLKGELSELKCKIYLTIIFLF